MLDGELKIQEKERFLWREQSKHVQLIRQLHGNTQNGIGSAHKHCHGGTLMTK